MKLMAGMFGWRPDNAKKRQIWHFLSDNDATISRVERQAAYFWSST